jgi:hypothetical protein
MLDLACLAFFAFLGGNCKREAVLHADRLGLGAPLNEGT